MIVDFTTQTGPYLWAIIAALLILALVLFTYIEPDLAEVYIGDVQLLVATLALAAIAISMLSMLSIRFEASHQFGDLVPGR